MLLEGEEIPAGEYEWMRLMVDAEPNVVDSYIDDRRRAVRTARAERSRDRAQVNRGFTVGVGAITDLTIDFDLRKSIVEPPGQSPSRRPATDRRTC